jgi:hypothetical protein
MKLDEILRVAQQVGRHTTYPISSADQLVNALGGEHATHRIGGKDHQAAEVQQTPRFLLAISTSSVIPPR